MTARSSMGGHAVHFDETSERWRYDDTREVAPVETRPCRHCKMRPVPVLVMIPADLSHTGKEHRKVVGVDACIATIVQALNHDATEPVTRGWCCGHGERDGAIALADGRRLMVQARQGDDAEQRHLERGGAGG